MGNREAKVETYGPERTLPGEPTPVDSRSSGDHRNCACTSTVTGGIPRRSRAPRGLRYTSSEDHTSCYLVGSGVPVGGQPSAPGLAFRDLQLRRVAVRARQDHPSILDVRIKSTDFRDVRNLDGVLQRLLSSPEVRTEMTRLGLQFGRPFLGFAKLAHPGTVGPDPVPIHLAEGSLRDALNRVMELAGRGSGVYREDHCGESPIVTLRFASRRAQSRGSVAALVDGSRYNTFAPRLSATALRGARIPGGVAQHPWFCSAGCY